MMIPRIAISLFFALATQSLASEKVDYLTQVKPLLTQHCYQCHSASQDKGGLRMDTAAFALQGGDSGPAYIPGDSAGSIMVQAMLGTHEDISRMPYKKPAMPKEEIDLLIAWIDQGAQAPADEQPDGAIHWAFVPPQRPELPSVETANWPRNPIDHFILARLEKENIQPSLEADRITQIRRLSLDLLGLPPSIEEVQAFVNDERPDAYEKLVDRLLASPHYGERWGRHWLDVARYADSNGYSVDAPRSIWKYRDWVIDAMNQDLPFDWFVIHQLAGDLLPNATREQKIATGFHRNTQINQEGGIDPEQFRIESIFDRVNTTSTAFLGLTVACAQCHDHKFDPISHKEYFQLFAFLNNDDEPNLEIASPEEIAERDAIRKKVADLNKSLVRYIDSFAADQAAWEASLTAEEKEKLKAVARVLERTPDKRNARQKQQVFEAFRKDDPEYKKRQAEIAEWEKKEPKFVTTMVLQQRKEPRETHIMIQGDFTRPGDRVSPGTLQVLHPMPDLANPDRLDLAKWIVDPKNPLTARVTINRMWQAYFGKGIVETENDFGTQGSGPTHPELLDWLATEFMRQKWSQKAMHRLIVTSATYRQSSSARPDLDITDPYNKLLARQTRLRLDAEIVRDVALKASGLFTDKIGGPGVFPPIPDGVMGLGQFRRDWNTSVGPDRFRRGMYTFFWRAVPHPSLSVFDAPDANSTCTRRIRSNTPLQALTLLNDSGFYEFAQGLALRVLREAPEKDAERIDYAFRLCLSRDPEPAERDRLHELLRLELSSFEQAPEEARRLVSRELPSEADVKQVAAWTTVSRVLLNLDETITRE